MIPPKYRFFLKVEGDVITSASPIYKADASIDYQQESNQRFFRKNLNGKMTFIREDYDLIMSANYEDKINFFMEISLDNGLTWSSYWDGVFSRVDCTINYDDKVITVQPTTADAYKLVLKGIEKEYNLIELKPEIQRIILAKRPLIQVYVPGDSVVSCFLSGCYWEEDADEVTSALALTNTYHFSLNTIVKEIEVTSNGGLDAAAGTYTGRVTYDADTGHWQGNLYRHGGGYFIDIDTYDFNFSDFHWTTVSAWLTRESDGVRLYGYLTSGDFDNLTFSMTPTAGSGMSGTMDCDMWTYNIFARLLCDVDEIFGNPTNTIPDDDIVTNNRNYRKCAGYAVPIAQISNRTSDEPTEWGRRDDGKYFQTPANIINIKYYPIAMSTWRWASLWFGHNYVDAETDKVARKQYVLQDAYPIHSCIAVLLHEVAPNLKHEPTTDYSEFLYADENPISGDKWRLFATQKTNILKGEYSEPARKAMTTLQEFLRMLQNVFGLYWFVDGDKLRIEHISWFKNGGSYSSGTRQVGYDLTTIVNIKNGKMWCYGQNEVTFDKTELPERYQYGWMDDVSNGFVGVPIDILSPNVEDGKIEDISVSGFTSDVDYMLLNPSECTNDGFALLAAIGANALTRDDSENYYPGFWGSHGEDGVNDDYSTPLYPANPAFIGKTCHVRMECSGNGIARAFFFDADGLPIGGCYKYNIQQGTTEFDMIGTIPDGAVSFGFYMDSGSLDFNVFGIDVDGEYELPFVKKTYDHAEFNLQNGYLSFMDLQPKYLTYDMPSKAIKVNGEETTAHGISRKAKQTIVFPSDAVDVDTNKLVKTLVGFGEFNQLSLNLSSRTIKATLCYDNDI